MNDDKSLEIKLETVTWKDVKNYAWAAILVLFGAAGGNVDRLYEQLPDVYGVSKLTQRVEAVESKLEVVDEVNSKLDILLKDKGTK